FSGQQLETKLYFCFSSRRRHTRFSRDWSSDVCSSDRFPPGLKRFGVEPDRVIFIDLKREKDVLWAMEQGLKCSTLSAVVGELQEIGRASCRERVDISAVGVAGIGQQRRRGGLDDCQQR